MTSRGRPKIDGKRIEYIEPNVDRLDAWAEAEGIARPELLRRITERAIKNYERRTK